MTAIERVLKKQLRLHDVRCMSEFYEFGYVDLKAYGKLRTVQQVVLDDNSQIVKIEYITL